MGDKFTFAHISSSASEPTKPFSRTVKPASPFIWGACLQACLLALCGSFTGFAALWGKKRLVVVPELLQPFGLPRKVGAVFGALPSARAEVEQFALSILDSSNCARTLEGKGSKRIPNLFVFV